MQEVEVVEHLKTFRACVRALKDSYTSSDLQNLVLREYGIDSRIIVAPPASACCSQPSVASLPAVNKPVANVLGIGFQDCPPSSGRLSQ